MKKTNITVISFLATLFLLALPICLKGQSTVTAVPDNYIMRPGVRMVLDVLANDAPGDCMTSELVLTILTTSSAGNPTATNPITWKKTPDNKIEVRTHTNAKGNTYKIEYRATCPSTGKNGKTTAYVTVSERPDFIDDASCTTPRPTFVWDIERKAYSTEFVHGYTSPIVGDLDGDGELEIIALNNGDNAGNTQYSNKVKIFNKNLQMVASFNVPQIASYVVGPMLIADVDNDGEGEIVIATADNDAGTSAYKYRLIAYKKNGTVVWTSSHSYFSSFPANFATYRYSAAPVIADIDGDGKAEILCGNRIFAAETGVLLATLPTGNGLAKRVYAASAVTDGFLPAIGDIDGDGIQEIVGGNTTYKVTINSRTDYTQNTAVVLAKIGLKDGFCSLADIDGDGILDVVVVGSDGTVGNPNGIMYCWQGSSAAQIGDTRPFKDPTASLAAIGSRPFLGDIDGDGNADIAFTYSRGFVAYKYNKATNKFVQMFQVGTSDTSGATTMSMFDFDNDGTMELVYRDETHLRIIDKSGNNIITFPCISGTHTEYPVIVDIDKDGHADIIVSGALAGVANNNAQVRLQRFGSITPKTWSPARTVWHQHGYNPTQINEDLTIPRYPMAPTTEFIRSADGSKHKPLNNFLAQAGVLNREGDFLNKTYDIAMNLTLPQKLYHNTGDILDITCHLMNTGSLDFTGNLRFELFAKSTTLGYISVGSEVIAGTQTLAMGQQNTYTWHIPSFSTIQAGLPTDLESWLVTVNLDNNGNLEPSGDNGYFQNQLECNDWNNKTTRISFVSGELILCENTTGTLTVDPVGTYKCEWFTKDAGGNLVPYPNAISNIGDSQPVTKASGTSVDKYYVLSYDLVTDYLVSAIPDELSVYRAPDTLVWTGYYNSDWHNQYNWHNPNDPTGSERSSYIPRMCTNILIPEYDLDGISKLTTYPDLTNGTSYAKYPKAQCNYITFEHGGEVIGSENLTYTGAYVQLSMNANRWYCFSPPLRNFYPADIYQTDPNPIADGMLAYTRLFSQTEPEHGSYIEGAWGRAFNTPNHTFKAGEGLGVWLDDLQPITTHAQIYTEYPKSDTNYYIYDEDGNIITGAYPASRTFANRFIFEDGSINTSTKEVAVNIEATNANKDILMGNPFLAHLDFDKFYAANSTLIKNYYRIIEADGTYATYYVSGTPSTGNPVLTKMISPMQAILLTPTTAFTSGSLKITPSMVASQPGIKLRSVKEEVNEDDKVVLKAAISDKTALRNRASLVLSSDNSFSNAYNSETDVYKMLKKGSKTYPSVYFLTTEGYYMDIKAAKLHEDLEIPIGFCYSETGPLSLNIERFWTLPDYDIYLVDKLLDKVVNIKSESVYSFSKDNTDEFTNNRFVLRFTKQGSGIKEQTQNELSIKYSVFGNMLTIESQGSNSLQSVTIYDLQGREILDRERLTTTKISYTLANGAYIVKVKTNNGIETFKVII